MNTTKSALKLTMRGSGQAVIDWGGQKETVTLDPVFPTPYTSPVLASGPKTIRIESEVINYLDCGDNQLTSLDVSKNTALRHLNCSYNNMNVSALNALFETLRSDGGSFKTIFYGQNPGADDCNSSIASAKGWN